MKHIPKISLYLVYIIAFALGLKQIHEPDLWWMFRTGEWMVENGQIPTEDMFSFTHKGVDWISVKWLFELIAYGFASLLGPESIGILQGIINVFIAYFLISTTTIISRSVFQQNVNKDHPIIVIGSLLFLFSIDYRLVGRPEMMSHILTIAFLYLFFRYKSKPGKFIFWLIPLQIIWVNIHEAYAVGMVLLGLFAAGELLDFLLSKDKDLPKLKQILIACGLAFLAVAVNPRGFYMFYHPYFLLTVVGSNHYTNELNSFFYRPEFFFSFKEPFIAFGSFAVSILAVVWLFIKQRIDLHSKVGLGYIGGIFAFLYLGLTGYRNVIFTIIFLFPICISFLLFLFGKLKNEGLLKASTIVALLAGIIFYIGIGTNEYYRIFNPANRYGLATYADSNPAGASNFIKTHGLENERAFSDYLTSSYLLWDQRPGFESFIDLRDLDIFPHSFFEEFMRITYYTNYFEESDAKYNYNHVILYTWEFQNLHRYLYHNPIWKQVYADNVAAVYLRNNERNKGIIEDYELDTTNLWGNFNRAYQPTPSTVSNGISYLFWPGYTLMTNQVDSSISASKYFRKVADFDRAEFHAENAVDNSINAYEGYDQLGNIYLEIVPFKRSPDDQLKYVTLAIDAFEKGYRMDKNRWECIYGLAQSAFIKGDFGYALKQFKKAENLNPDNLSIIVKIADCYSNIAQNSSNLKFSDGYFKYLLKAYKKDGENMIIISRLAIEYTNRNQCKEAEPLLRKYKRTAEIPEQLDAQVKLCKSKCRLK